MTTAVIALSVAAVIAILFAAVGFMISPQRPPTRNSDCYTSDRCELDTHCMFVERCAMQAEQARSAFVDEHTSRS